MEGFLAGTGNVWELLHLPKGLQQCTNWKGIQTIVPAIFTVYLCWICIQLLINSKHEFKFVEANPITFCMINFVDVLTASAHLRIHWNIQFDWGFLNSVMQLCIKLKLCLNGDTGNCSFDLQCGVYLLIWNRKDWESIRCQENRVD